MPEPIPFERLPTSVIPKHYKVTLHPNLVKCTFKGSVEIDVEIKEAVKEIKLNSLNLKLTDLKLSKGDEDFIPSSTDISVETETVKLSFSSAIPICNAKLCMNFEGDLNDKLKGFYRSKYTTAGEERYSAVTQFEPTDARRCFPCWDEPAIKATFDIILVSPQDRVALSNMPEESNEPYEGEEKLRLIKYATSPPMSTYLVAVVVGEFDYVEDTTTDGIKVRIYTPVGKKEQGRFALEITTKVLPYYKDYFKIAYPLPKIDLIAIADFSAGAMENWGLVTYRESCLLLDPENSSTSNKQWVALTVGHEVAHQWFGNLVTMEWWTHLWLNEGYASFVECLCVDHLFPEYNIWMQMVTMMHNMALDLDCLRNSHAVEVVVGHPAEVEEIFDDISYHKGASIIRMLHNYIGDADFRAGMHKYLTKHQYKNTRTEDLWAALGEAANKPVGSIMSTWTRQTGYPMISVASSQDGQNRILTVSQQRFLADGSTDDKTQWMIPLTFCSGNSPTTVAKKVLLDSKEIQVELPGVSEDVWVKLNPGTIGFYRVKYPTKMLEQLLPAIKSNVLQPLDRLGILDDLFSMVQAGHSSTVEVLKLLNALRSETDYTVWNTMHSVIAKLNQLLSHTDFHGLFALYAVKIYSQIGNKLGWETKEGESHQDTLLRSLVIGQLGYYGDKGAVDEARSRFQGHLNKTQILPADLRGPVYKALISNGDEKVYQQLLKLYRESDHHEEMDRILRSIGITKDPNLIQQVLQFAMSDEVRHQDTVFVIVSVAMSAPGRTAAWAFFKKHHKELLERYEGGFLLTKLVKQLTCNFASEEMAQEVEAFFKEHTFPSTERTHQQSLETIRLNTSWLSRDASDVHKFLLSQVE